jgi:uncharacterized protein
MFRILIFIFIAFLVWLLVRVVGRNRAREDRPSAAASTNQPAATKSLENITQCAWCGAHVPDSDAVTLPDGRVYCGGAHRNAARAVSSASDGGRS